MGLLGGGKRIRGYDTPLSPEQEAEYQRWRLRLSENLQGERDYDLRGAYASNAQAAGNGHLPDTYKKPNHMTFSDESQYSTPEQQGGRWVEDGKGGWVFWASPFNASQHSMRELADYFQRNETGSSVIFPSRFKLPPRR